MYDKAWIKWGLVPLILFGFWLAFSLLYINNTSGFTILAHQHNSSNIVSGITSELLAGEKIKGEFQAKDNNLGIIALRFNTFFRINEDIVRFRIKEKGQKNWQYENNYTTPQFQPNQLFPFGFPVIDNSEGKTYQFEIESLHGEPANAVALSPIEPVFVSKYQYSKQRILTDKQYLIRYLYTKVLNTISSTDFIVSTFSYLLPFLIYLITIIFFTKHLSDKYYLICLPLLAMIVLSMTNTSGNEGAVIGLTAFWIYMLLLYRIEGAFSFFFALGFIVASLVLYYLGMSDLSKNLTMWGYMLLVAGIILQIVEIIWKRESIVALSSVTDLKNLFKKEKGK